MSCESISRGCGYLLDTQNAAGYWTDFELPTGSSDAWVTAFVALSLSHANTRIHSTEIASSIQSAICWLTGERHYAAGWGYNQSTGPDADTTGYVVSLLKKHKYPVDSCDYQFLLDLHADSGGFATYPKEDAWGLAHPDVTPIAFSALNNGSKLKMLSKTAGYLHNNQIEPGFWPAYWWKNCHYSTYHNLKLAIELGLAEAPVELKLPRRHSFLIESAFDLAWLTASASLYSNRDYYDLLCAELLALQQPSGFWPGGANLRVTDPHCAQPWETSATPVGKYYVDKEHSITTASSIWTLSLI